MTTWRLQLTAALVLILTRASLWLGYGSTVLPKSPFGDPLVYSKLAKVFAANEPWPIEVVFRSPLYTYIVSLSYKVFGATPIPLILLQNILGVVSGLLLIDLLLKLDLKRSYLIPCVLTILALSGVWMAYEWKLYPVSLATFLEVALLYSVFLIFRKPGTSLKLHHIQLGSASVVLALLILLRPNFQLLLPIACVAFLLPNLRKCFGLTPVLYVTIVPLAFMSPILIRNHNLGAGYNLMANSGLTLVHGNNERSQGGYSPAPGVSSDVLFQNGDALRVAKKHGAGTIPEADKYWRQQAVSFLLASPSRTLKLVMAKALGFVVPFEAGGDMPWRFEKRLVPILSFVGLINFSFLLFFALLGTREFAAKSPPLFYTSLSLFAVTLLTCLIFYMNNRYRLPAWPLLVMPASIGLSAFVNRWVNLVRAKGFVGFFNLPCLTKAFMALTLLGLTLSTNLTKNEFIAGWHNLGVASSRAGFVEEAIVAYNKVLEVNPDHAPTLNNLSLLYRNSNRKKLEETTIRKRIQSEPNNFLGYLQLAELKFNKHKMNAAKTAATTALRFNPDSLRAKEIIAMSDFILENYDFACPALFQLADASRDDVLHSFKRSCDYVWKSKDSAAADR